MALKHENLTGQIIKAFYKVYNELGYGFLEKVYEKALALELASTGLRLDDSSRSRFTTSASGLATIMLIWLSRIW